MGIDMGTTVKKLVEKLRVAHCDAFNIIQQVSVLLILGACTLHNMKTQNFTTRIKR